jgi:excisionase family DNA binding protein
MNLEGRRWISCREAADYLGVHPQTVYAWVESGAIPAVRINHNGKPGRHNATVRIDLKALDADLERKTTGGRKGPGPTLRASTP